MPSEGELLVRKVVAAVAAATAAAAAAAIVMRVFVLAVVAGDGSAIAIVSVPSTMHATCIGQLGADASPIAAATATAAATQLHRAWTWMHPLERLKVIIGLVGGQFSNRGWS